MTLTKRWSRQDDFDGEVATVAQRYRLEPALIKAVVAAESSFNPLAHRAESPRPSLPPTPDFPEGGDASFGLMQVLARTARALGYKGTLDGLFHPATSLDLGARLLRDNMNRTSNNVADSISAYNGGFRPSLGFGSPLPSGEYGNQVHVSRVLSHLDYFRAWERQKGGAGLTPATFPAGPVGHPWVDPGAGVVAPVRVTWWERLWQWIRGRYAN